MARDQSSQTYDCSCAGCESGGTFEAAPLEWWEKKNLQPPTRCAECRAWIRAQNGTDPEQVSCKGCDRSYPFTDKARISEHINNGSWSDFVDDFTCRRCKENPGWNERGQYVCEFASCKKSFEGPSRQLAAQKGWKKPTACPDCREGIRREHALGDVTVRCANELCGFAWKEKPATRIWRLINGRAATPYCRRCDEQPERRHKQEYACKCAGCFEKRRFMAKHESFYPKGVPTVCETCSNWLREQGEIGPVDVPCTFCGNHFTIEVHERQRHHFQNEEGWDKHFRKHGNLVCRPCQKSLQERGARFHRMVDARLRGYRNGILVDAATIEAVRQELERSRAIASENGLRGNVESYDVPDDPDFYENIRDRKHDTALGHIGQGSHKFEKVGLHWVSSQIVAAAELARRTDENVAQAFQENGRIVKIDLETGLNVVIVPCRQSSSGWRILTAFVSMGQADRFQNKLRKGEWRRDF